MQRRPLKRRAAATATSNSRQTRSRRQPKQATPSLAGIAATPTSPKQSAANIATQNFKDLRQTITQLKTSNPETFKPSQFQAMTNKGFNPLFVSALDILTGALGVFIILNFLNTRLMGVPPTPVNPPGLEKKTEQGKTQASNKPRPADEPRAWWRKPQPSEPVKPQVPPQTSTPTPKPETPQPTTSNQQPTTNNQQPSDPVTVDLMKQTKGAVVILLQQADQSKQSVEFMLRQGNRTWKPGRASKFQDNGFHYEKALTYFYQTEIELGTYEVLVRVKKGQKSAGSKPFSLYGKIVPPGQKAQTYNFGTFSMNGAASDWISAGTFRVSAGGLQYQSRLPAATKTETDPATNTPPTATKPVPATKPSGRNGKWG